ncbi:hypothetical protein M885DRAFT_551620 [Pelagophyceae sp. CCMP2097]|nr:hypothetical protein M885DRAFT_551620 [Pelagophyceae sp. CCMP2097]
MARLTRAAAVAVLVACGKTGVFGLRVFKPAPAHEAAGEACAAAMDGTCLVPEPVPGPAPAPREAPRAPRGLVDAPAPAPPDEPQEPDERPSLQEQFTEGVRRARELRGLNADQERPVSQSRRLKAERKARSKAKRAEREDDSAPAEDGDDHGRCDGLEPMLCDRLKRQRRRKDERDAARAAKAS